MFSSFHSRIGVLVFIAILASTLSFAASVSVSPSVGPPTTKATATGAGFSSGETVNVTLDSAALGSATATSAGTFSLAVVVPRPTQPGAHTVQATGQTSGLT